MNLATVLHLTAILEVAAAVAGWMGGLTYALCRPARRAAAWRHAVAASASVGLAVFTYFTALVALGQGVALSGSEGRAPAAAGLLVLAIVLGLGAGVPWGLFRHERARPALGADTGDGAEGVWPVARRTSAALFLPFAILGLAVFAPRVRTGSSTAGTILVGALLAVVLAAIAVTVFRRSAPTHARAERTAVTPAAAHLAAIFKLAAWGALVGVPVVTALMALSGAPLGESFVFSAASALAWAPVFGSVAWAATGMHEAGFNLHHGGVTYSRSAWISGERTEGTSPKRAERRPPRRTRRRNRRR